MRRLLTFVALLLAVPAAGFSQSIETTVDGQQIKPDYQSVQRSDGSTLPAARGVWRANGYGYLVEVTDTKIHAFNETSTLMWPQSDVEPVQLAFYKIPDSNRAAFSLDPKFPPIICERISGLPKKAKPQTWTPRQVFAAFEETMRENYVFFAERNFDWADRMKGIRPKVNDSLTEAQLFELLEASLQGIDDGHVQLGATIDGVPRRPPIGLSETEKLGIQLFESQTEETDFEQYLQKRIQQYELGIARDILQGKVRQSCNELTWGTTKNNVGYLQIAGMAGFSDAESLEGELAELHEAMNELLRDLAPTKALIVDVGINGGGSDVYSLAIASHFADRRRLAIAKGPRKIHGIAHAIYLEPYVQKDAVTYTKPVYLAINDVTMSAAEIFVLCMKDLPHVTTVGKSTRGALSDVLSKTLPNGWAFGLSNEIYTDANGKCFEAIGIPPEIPLKLVDPTKPGLGHAAAILKVADMAK